MKTTCWILASALLSLSSCGLAVPEIEEFWGNSTDAALKVNAIAGQIKCEIGRAVSNILVEDRNLEQGKRQYEWLEKWAAVVSMQFTINEKSAFSPSLNLINVRSATETFTGSLGAGLSSEATRTDKLSATFYFNELVNRKSMDLTCIPAQTWKGDLFVSSDLKIEQWLQIALTPEKMNIVSYRKNGRADAISHEIKYEIISNGSANPSWKLVDVSNNTGQSSVFDVKRGRVQTLTITMGPTEGKGDNRTLRPQARDLLQSNTIGAGIAAAIANTR
ncbi:hypothetical protein HGO34_25865 [Agrobacterium vitis]|uniref:Uncharacterized protein n=1 Tax=Agrobacterium vitis TaxID=373 RepID=A0AAE5AYM6_AGRVI|nr:hypothetical protein [Agrobacterium vitis]MCF1497083.1 hypothetical protein [Allorhizobium sp. Av2]MCM2443132.1 hypothetical protein [Agrobacterium vitis]MUZ60741.1 hypothetical protein [Agrobacterium vitis]MVA68926.1 hypothetical protein [Agrobacterium vitis]MVA90048.1 hypothetical protein [Agrobacterium vitis]